MWNSTQLNESTSHHISFYYLCCNSVFQQLFFLLCNQLRAMNARMLLMLSSTFNIHNKNTNNSIHLDWLSLSCHQCHHILHSLTLTAQSKSKMENASSRFKWQLRYLIEKYFQLFYKFYLHWCRSSLPPPVDAAALVSTSISVCLRPSIRIPVGIPRAFVIRWFGLSRCEWCSCCQLNCNQTRMGKKKKKKRDNGEHMNKEL